MAIPDNLQPLYNLLNEIESSILIQEELRFYRDALGNPRFYNFANEYVFFAIMDSRGVIIYHLLVYNSTNNSDIIYLCEKVVENYSEYNYADIEPILHRVPPPNSPSSIAGSISNAHLKSSKPPKATVRRIRR